jgi:hypothetical protein
MINVSLFRAKTVQKNRLFSKEHALCTTFCFMYIFAYRPYKQKNLAFERFFVANFAGSA